MKVTEKKKYKSVQSDVNYTSKAAYKKFVKETGRSDISYQTYVDTITTVHQKAIDKLFSGNYSIKLPDIGLLKLLKLTPTKRLNGRIDWGLYNKTGVWAPFRNTHTDGKIYKAHFYAYHKKYVPLGFFRFQLAEKHQKALAEKIKSNTLPR